MEYKVALSERGQVVIPAEIRKKFKTREFILLFEEGKIIMYPSNTIAKMKNLVHKIKDMNKKFEKFSKENLSVTEEIKKGGA